MSQDETRLSDWPLLAVIGAGSVAGSLGRYAVSCLIPHQSGRWPWATFSVNLIGCLGMGLLVAWLTAKPGAHRLVRPGLGVGFLGGWTTFSAFALETFGLFHRQLPILAFGYVLASIIGGVALVGVGTVAGQRLWSQG